MTEENTDSESKEKAKKNRKLTEEKEKKSKKGTKKSSSTKKVPKEKEKSPRSSKNKKSATYKKLKERAAQPDIVGSTPLVPSPGTLPRKRISKKNKEKDGETKKKSKDKSSSKKKKSKGKSSADKADVVKEARMASEKSVGSEDLSLDEMHLQDDNGDVAPSNEIKIEEGDSKHSAKVLKKKLDKVGSLLSTADPSSEKYKKLAKKRLEYITSLEEMGINVDYLTKQGDGETASHAETAEPASHAEIASHDTGIETGPIEAGSEYGDMGLNDDEEEGYMDINGGEMGLNDGGEMGLNDGDVGWSKSSRAKADKMKRRQSSLGRHAERKRSMKNDLKKNKSIARTKGFREAAVNEDFSVPVFKKTKDEKMFLRESLSSDFVFQNLDHKSFNLFIGAFEEVEYEKGQNIITEGDMGDYFYVVSEGKVKFFINGRRAGSGNRGKSFGESALISSAPRSATVTAAEAPTKLFRVDQKTFKFITQKSAKELRQQKLELLMAVDFLNDLVNDDLQRLCDLMVPRVVKKGKYLYRKGAEASAFYLLQSGEMKATDIIVGETVFEDILIQPGDYFGQNALARDAPRENSIIALEDSNVFGIDRSTFDKVLGSFYNVILKTNDRQLLGHIEVIKNLKLDTFLLVSLAEQVVEVQFFEGEVIFAEGEEIEPALYLVRDGRVDISAGHGDDKKTLAEEMYFGDDILLSKTDKVEAKYTVTAAEDIVCGCLTLKACKLVLDLEEGEENDGKAKSRRQSMHELTLADNKTMQRRSVQSASFASGIVTVEDLEKIKIVGEGEYGQVWLGKSKDLDEVFALKIQKLQQGGESFYDNIKREVATMGALHHPYIVGLITSKFTGNECFMVMDYITGGELWSVIHRQINGIWISGIEESYAQFYALIIADTISYMHQRNILFRDLKPENIMIDNDGYPNIIDFGFSKITTEKTYTYCGTPNYVAPEIVLNHGHSVGVDHWALGVIIYEMLSGENPFWYDGMDTMALYEIIVKDEPYPLECESANDVVENLIDGLLEKDSSQRLGVLAGKDKDILFHPWFSNLNLQELRHKRVAAPWLPPMDPDEE